MSRTLAASLTIAVGASLWGLYWVPLRAIEAAGIEGAAAVAVFNGPALVVSAAALLVWLARGGRMSSAVLLAGVMAGLGLALYAMGLVFTTVVRATLLFYLTPVWSTLLAIVILGERPGWARWAALALAFAGLALIMGLGGGEIEAGPSRGFGFGEALGLASGAAWGLAAVLIRRAEASGPDLVFHQFAAVVIAALVAMALIGEPAPSAGAVAAAMTPLVVGMSLAVLASIFAIFWAVAQISPGRSGLLMMTEVVVAVISAAILLPEEAMSTTEWIGAGLIVSAGLAEVFGESG